MIDIRHGRIEGCHVLSMRGHAGYADKGGDIVCAGVSAITYALLGWLANHDPGQFYRVVEPGETMIIVQEGRDIDTAFSVALIGLAQIAQKYPDNVTMTYSAEGGDSREQTAGKEHGDHAEH